MSRRALLVVAAIAVVSIALTFLADQGGDTPGFQGQAFVPEVAAALGDVDRVEIVVAGNETVATLVRAENGWSVVEKDGYPADIAAIRTALVGLAEAATLETKTADPAFYERLGVEDIALESARGVAVTASSNGEPLPTVILGDSVGTSYRYARRADRAESYLIDRDPEVPRDVAQWLVSDIMDVPGTRVQQVSITHADGEQLLLSKTTPGQNNFSVADVPEERELSYPGVANVVGNALRELKLEDVARHTESEMAPAATVRYETFDGLMVTATAYVPEDADTGWLTFEAQFDPDQAAEFATEAVEEPLAEAEAETGADPRAEAEEINARVSGWRYRIASYQYDQMTRRMDDLLKAPGS